MLCNGIVAITCLLAGIALAADSSSSSTLSSASSSVKSLSSSITDSVTVLSGSTSELVEATLPTGSYISYTSTIVFDTSSSSTSSEPTDSTLSSFGSVSDGATSFATSNGTSSSATSISTSSASKTVLTGHSHSTTTTAIYGTMTGNSTSSSTSRSSTSSSAQPTNTTPCNNYPELCGRKFSNITEVCAHNSPFVKPDNAASNQELPVLTQLDDGIRMLQAQTHFVNDTLYLCHTSCDVLNVGPLESWLAVVYTWVARHPYDVVTILLGNGDYVGVGNFSAPIVDSGLARYAYTPPRAPMALDDWPTLSAMILAGQRVVFFLDYDANETAYPYILDEFSQLWETPFDPTDDAFPCTVQRPPGLAGGGAAATAAARARMYMANHNLNTEVSLLGASLLVPTTTMLNVTNNVTGHGSLGETARDCTNMWGRPPNRLNVDYYDVGNGSVFEVAAKCNNLTYNRPCCGKKASGAVRIEGNGMMWTAAGCIGMATVLIML